MTKEQILELKRGRLNKILARPDIKSYGVINKLRREIRNLESK